MKSKAENSMMATESERQFIGDILADDNSDYG
jgi:hypothetical protein